MATKTCPSCGGSGTNNPNRSKGSMSNICSSCNGSGQVQDHSSLTNNGCFPGNTPILTPTGWRDIATIESDQSVISIDACGN